VTGVPAPIAVGVFPAAGLKRRRALFGALEDAFPVRFEGRGPGELRDLDAALELGGGEQAAEADAAGLPALSLVVSEPAGDGAPAAQTLTAAPELDRRLRGAVLPDTKVERALRSGPGLGPPERAVVLGSCSGEPTWIRAGGLGKALLAPSELNADEALRERLCDGRSAALLPLVHFLRELTAQIRWQPPVARASLLFDDPNLHWPSYGFVKLRELSAHARANRYHVALATVPLDTWFAHRAAVRALKESHGAISLLVHGNDHDGGELGRPAAAGEAVAMAAQALRRVRAFERRTGISVNRVMVPPHEECSEATVRGLLRCGFEAITMTRPFPWLARPPRSWLARPEGAGSLVGWHPADFAGGLPVLLRHPLIQRDAPELVLRAFLDQPLILYGHHGDVSEGLGVLASAVDDVNWLRETRWCSLGEIAAGNFETRLQGSRLGVRPFARRVRLQVPAAAEQLLVELPSAHPGPSAERLTVDGRAARIGEPVSVAPGATIQIELHATDEVDPRSVPPPRRRPLAIARRVAGESRDRLLPLVSRARQGRWDTGQTGQTGQP
jgi:hypothetical protein